MFGGSLYEYLHTQKAALTLPFLLKVAINVCEGMNYLHQNNIIHRDLKTANLLMDKNGVIDYLLCHLLRNLLGFCSKQ